tara:strand:+ start:2266 stop:2391 length:126 start_codon:yes stop_codon:yes gene_type:complete
MVGNWFALHDVQEGAARLLLSPTWIHTMAGESTDSIGSAFS